VLTVRTRPCLLALLAGARTRRAAWAVWRELGCPVQFHPDGLQGYELLGRPVPADPLAPLRGQWYVLRQAVGWPAVWRMVHDLAVWRMVHDLGRAVQRECFDLRVLWGAFTRPGLVWVMAQTELAGPDDEDMVDLHLVPVGLDQVREWFGQRRVDSAPSLTRRMITWRWHQECP